VREPPLDGIRQLEEKNDPGDDLLRFIGAVMDPELDGVVETVGREIQAVIAVEVGRPIGSELLQVLAVHGSAVGVVPPGGRNEPPYHLPLDLGPDLRQLQHVPPVPVVGVDVDVSPAGRVHACPRLFPGIESLS